MMSLKKDLVIGVELITKLYVEQLFTIYFMVELEILK
jgi:hypothetical protein